MEQVKEYPIIFSGPMVNAILEGRKMMTRRVLKHQEGRQVKRSNGLNDIGGAAGMWFNGERVFSCPYGDPGDRLWVRETWCEADELLDGVKREPAVTIGYKADLSARFKGQPLDVFGWNWEHESVKWRAAIYMPRWASRISLEIVSVRVERLQEITPNDARAEGLPAYVATPESDFYSIYRNAFRKLWDPINAKRGYSWESNPWVWVVEFKMVEGGRG